MKIYVIGIGPGGKADMTLRAIETLQTCDCIAGYGLYLDLIADFIEGKQTIQTGMTKEVDRCIAARDAALQGKTVAVVSSGDAGIYGMAGLMFEVCANYPELQVEVIAGITAASAGGAVLGAPLTNDFCVISLSDLLTPWETIVKRLQAAGAGDFCVCLYNPSSRKRNDYLQKACDILLQTRSEKTPCGLVRNIGREGQSHTITTLGELRNTPVDMLTTVWIGNSVTTVIGEHLVTPRGYRGV